MAPSVGKLENRYSSKMAGMCRPLLECVARPVALSLLVFFLLANAATGLADLQADHWTGQSSKSAQSSLNSQSDLQSDTANCNELRSGREGAGNHSFVKLEFKNHQRRLVISSSLESPGIIFSSGVPILQSVSLCESPFSPRPPPA